MDPGFLLVAYYLIASGLQAVALVRAPGECPPCVCALDARESECVLESVFARSPEVIQDVCQVCSISRAELRSNSLCSSEGSRFWLLVLFILGCLVGSRPTVIVSCCLSVSRRTVRGLLVQPDAHRALADMTDQESEPRVSTPSVLRANGRGKWIVGTPEFDVQYAYLSEHRVIPLGRDEPIPRRYRAQTCAFDVPIEPDTLVHMRRAGRDLLEVFGLVGSAGAAHVGGRCRVSDPAHAAFSDELPEGV
ncbi:unnamed protein product, partial [Prorocentrum cordatum]